VPQFSTIAGFDQPMAVYPMRALILLLATLALPACTAMLLGNNTSGSERASTRSAGSSPSTADNRISGTIRQQYSNDAEIRNFALGIRTASGRVTLTGTVGSYELRDRVVDIAKNTHGVVSVDSRVVVNTNL
jgi:osmotically-inducible protein OsmY